MRRLAVLLTLVALVACGDDAYHSPPEVPTITRAKASRVARAGVLKAADLPGYRSAAASSAADDDDETGNAADNLASCIPNTPYVAENATDFEHGNVSVISEVHVAPTMDRVRSDYALLSGDFFPPCFRRGMNVLAQRLGGELVDFASRAFAVHVPTSDGAFGLSIRYTLRAGNGRMPFHWVLVGAVVDHAEVLVSGSGTGRDAPPATRLTALLTKSVKRTRAAL